MHLFPTLQGLHRLEFMRPDFSRFGKQLGITYKHYQKTEAI